MVLRPHFFKRITKNKIKHRNKLANWTVFDGGDGTFVKEPNQ